MFDDTHGAKKSRFFARLWLKTVHRTVFLTRRPVEQPHKLGFCYKVISSSLSEQKEKNTFWCSFFLSFLHKIAVSEKDTTSYHRKEISEYSSTSFYIGKDITQNDIKAKYENGILSLTIPKLQPRIIEKRYIAIE